MIGLTRAPDCDPTHCTASRSSNLAVSSRRDPYGGASPAPTWTTTLAGIGTNFVSHPAQPAGAAAQTHLVAHPCPATGWSSLSRRVMLWREGLPGNPRKRSKAGPTRPAPREASGGRRIKGCHLLARGRALNIIDVPDRPINLDRNSGQKANIEEDNVVAFVANCSIARRHSRFQSSKRYR